MKSKSRAPRASSLVSLDTPDHALVAHDGSFPIVAVGASAGGLEAYTQLFRALPAKTGMAFVVVQHLDPNHQSKLSDLIAKTTKLPVEEVRSGVTVKVDHIYVIPPNAFLTIAEGVFSLTPRSKELGQHLAVNHFMRSLAENHGNKAIGVILSGTGADGTPGLETIKAEGGITFAQTPSTAKYDGMPQSAIDSGCVDFILPPKDIAAELLRIQHHPYVLQQEAVNEAAEANSPEPPLGDFAVILEELRRASLVDFSQYRPNTIQRRALRRMVILKLDSLSDYALYMKEHPDEGEKLYDDILIAVTSFFRDTEAFESLKKHVFPAIVADKANKGTIRIWAPGCSTGEETYSLAMTLLECLGDKASSFQVQIFGTDLNEKGIQKARAGIYRESIAEEVSPERLQRFFVKVANGYRVNKGVRDMCIFARQNLAVDPPFSQMNLVVCRNLLIYIQPVLQKKIIPILHYALKSPGFLMLGSSESVAAYPDVFSTVDKKQKIYSKKLSGRRLSYDFGNTFHPAEKGHPLPKRASQPRDLPVPEIDFQAEADRLVLKKHAPVGVVVNSAMEVVQFRGRTTPYLEPAPGRPTLNLLKLARNGLALELRSLINAATKKDVPVKKDAVAFDDNGHKRLLNLSVSPLGEKGSGYKRCFLVLFEPVLLPQATNSKGNGQPKTRETAQNKQEVKRLKLELADAMDALHAAVESEDSFKEEFQSVNEEILSANEELQSTNEELETSKEELQSANEELNTLTEELRNHNVDLSQLSNDLSNLLDAIRIPIVFVGADLRIRRFTSTATEIFRLLPSDIGRPITDIKHDLDVPDLAKMIQLTVANLVSTQREIKDVAGRWRSLEIRPYRTGDNRIEGAIVALPDIDRLKHSEQYLKQIIDNVPNPLLVLDQDLKILLANLSFCTTFEVSQAETAGQLLYRLGNEQWNIPKLKVLLEDVLTKKSFVRDFVVAHEFPGIGWKTMLVGAQRIEDIAGGGRAMILLAVEDITERRSAEEAEKRFSQEIEKQARTFDTALSSITDFAYTFDRSGRFVYANKPLLDVWGLTLEQAVGKTFFELPYPHDLALKFQGQIQQVFATGQKITDETQYTSPAGAVGYYEYIFNPIISADGNCEMIAGSTRDVTGRKQAEAALLKSEKLAAAGRLAATLAHEINNPLQAVTNLMTLLKQSPALSSEDLAHASTADEELGRIAHLTQQSLGFYRESIFPTSVDLEQVLDSIFTLYAKRTKARNISITKQYRSDGATIDSYPGEIRQVFSTLLLNAMEAIPDNGTIAIRVRQGVHWKDAAVHGIQIAFADNGVGIPAKNKSHIFEPFFTTKGEQGTGLGLWVANEIVNRLGGSLRMRSSVNPEKRGTCFSMFLPDNLPGTLASNVGLADGVRNRLGKTTRLPAATKVGM